MKVTRREFGKVSLAGIACAIFPFLGDFPVIEKKEVVRELRHGEHKAFIPEIWSKKLQKRFYDESVFSKMRYDIDTHVLKNVYSDTVKIGKRL